MGPGPIYALSFWPFSHSAVMPFVLPSRAGLFGGSAWAGQVLKWLGAPSYHGPVLIRGRKLTGRDGLGFNAGVVPQAEMDLPPYGVLNPAAGGNGQGYVRLRSPGCYGLQVDGTTFREVIIFRACLSSIPCSRPAAAGHRDRRPPDIPAVSGATYPAAGRAEYAPMGLAAVVLIGLHPTSAPTGRFCAP